MTHNQKEIDALIEAVFHCHGIMPKTVQDAFKPFRTAMSDFDEWALAFGVFFDEQEHSIAVSAFNAGQQAQIEKDAEIDIIPSRLGNPVHGYTCGYNDGWYAYQAAIRAQIKETEL